MVFNEVFPKIKDCSELDSVFKNVEVKRIVRTDKGTHLDIYTSSSKDCISKENIKSMEEFLEKKLFEDRIGVRLDFFFQPVSNQPAKDKEGSGTQSGSTSKSSNYSKGGYYSGGGYKRKAKKTDEGMIYGPSFDIEPTPISDIVSACRNIAVKGEICFVEKTTTKKGTMILKLAVTDYKNSISAKMFLGEGEENLDEKLKNGMPVMINGSVDYDNYEGEYLIFPIKAIMPLEEKLIKRADNEPVKRVELHLHTQFSAMDAVTNIPALIDKAVSFGHKALAITDHGVVQGFPPALHKLDDLKKKNKDLDFKLIYGVEGYIVDDSEMPVCDPDSEEDIELMRYSCIEDENPVEPDPKIEEAIAKVKKAHMHHIVILIKNEIGRINLYRLVSYAHINYFKKKPRIPRSVLQKYREGLIIGSACVMGELAEAILSGKSDEELDEIASFYDYLEIQPLGNNAFLMRNYQNNSKGFRVKDEEGLKDINRKILEIGDRLGKKVVATGDVHFLNPEDEVFRRIILDSMGFDDADSQAPLYYRTTEEMLAEFDYLGEERAREVVIENTNYIADLIENISPVFPDKCPPVIENSEENLKNIVYENAKKMYSENLPEIVEARLQRELNSIISNGYAVMFIIARDLVLKSVSDGYLVGSRGSVGSSLVATMAGITEVNPLAPHYRCEKCQYSEFDSEEIKSVQGGSGSDLPDKLCPVCGEPLIKDGFDIPFETFMGFEGNKEPDIDLNFSGEYQSKAHDYTEVLFGKGHTFRAGTISTCAEKTAYGYVKGYMERHHKQLRKCEMQRLAKGCENVKRSTGQHPGGIVVLPHGNEIYQFTPVQFPADDEDKLTVTTHFEYHSIDHNLLKLDILGHDDPTMIKMLEDLTGYGCRQIKLDNKDVLKLFEGTEVLGVKPEDLNGCQLGTLGVPEFGTDFVIRMLLDTKPKNFSDLVRIAGLSHGTDVWTSNAEELVKSKTATLSTCICTRDDIMLYLIQMGVEPSKAFKIMESVRKGKGLTEDMEKVMKAANVPDWYLWSCKKIQYMFPKAHAVAYVMMAFRIAYYKIFYPLAYYAAFFSIRASAFDYELMCGGKEKLIENMNRLKIKRDSGEATQKEEDRLKNMNNVLEMYARGFEFLPIDIYKAKADRFTIVDGKLMPAFTSIDGMGEKAAMMLEAEAAKEPFTSREDMKIRAKLSSTLVEKLYSLGICGKLPESSQISFADLFGIKM